MWVLQDQNLTLRSVMRPGTYQTWGRDGTPVYPKVVLVRGVCRPLELFPGNLLQTMCLPFVHKCFVVALLLLNVHAGKSLGLAF